MRNGGKRAGWTCICCQKHGQQRLQWLNNSQGSSCDHDARASAVLIVRVLVRIWLLGNVIVSGIVMSNFSANVAVKDVGIRQRNTSWKAYRYARRKYQYEHKQLGRLARRP